MTAGPSSTSGPTMRAIQVRHTGGPDVLKIAHVPRPSIARDQVLVKNAFSGVNFIDTYHRTGLYPLHVPFIPGREGSGIVEAAGADVDKVRSGDHVVYLGPGSYAEYTAVSATKLYRLPSDVSLQVGAACLLQGMTALALLRYAYPVQKGDWVLVHAAAGGTGRLLVQLAKRFGAHVIATTSTAEKAQIAKELGADHVVIMQGEPDVAHAEVTAKVSVATEGKGVHAAFDGVGRDTFSTSLACLRRRGYLVLFGNASGKVPELDVLVLSPRNVYLCRPTLWEYLPDQAAFDQLAGELVGLLRSNPPLDVAVHQTFRLEDAASAHNELESRNAVGKILLQI